MKTYAKLLLSSAVLVTVFAISNADAGELEGCTLKTLKGSWGYSITILRTSNAGVGVFIFDGEGGAEGDGIAQISGDIFDQSWQGTYRMGPNCTVNATLTDNRGSVFNFFFVLVNEGKEFQIIRTDVGHTLVGFAKKQ